MPKQTVAKAKAAKRDRRAAPAKRMPPHVNE
jgi:hypothetical protein